LKASQRLEQQLKESEADRAARLEVIQKIESQLKELKLVLGQVRSDLQVFRKSKLVRFLLRLGLVIDSKKSRRPKKETGQEEP